jgi:hypothetical protein
VALPQPALAQRLRAQPLPAMHLLRNQVAQASGMRPVEAAHEACTLTVMIQASKGAQARALQVQAWWALGQSVLKHPRGLRLQGSKQLVTTKRMTWVLTRRARPVERRLGTAGLVTTRKPRLRRRTACPTRALTAATAHVALRLRRQEVLTKLGSAALRGATSGEGPVAAVQGPAARLAVVARQTRRRKRLTAALATLLVVLVVATAAERSLLGARSSTTARTTMAQPV